MTILFKEPEPEKQPGLSAGLDGRVIFLHQKGFWIAAEDNPADLITVHIAEPTRRTILPEPRESRQPHGVLSIPVSFA